MKKIIAFIKEMRKSNKVLLGLWFFISFIGAGNVPENYLFSFPGMAVIFFPIIIISELNNNPILRKRMSLTTPQCVACFVIVFFFAGGLIYFFAGLINEIPFVTSVFSSIFSIIFALIIWLFVFKKNSNKMKNLNSKRLKDRNDMSQNMQEVDVDCKNVAELKPIYSTADIKEVRDIVSFVQTTRKNIVVSDNYFKRAVDLITKTGEASISAFQSHFDMEYSRALQLMNELENYGVVGPYRGTQPRRVELSREYWKIIESHIITPVMIRLAEDAKYGQLFISAVDFLFEAKSINVSSLQRNLKISYNTAVNLLDDIKAVGFINPYTSTSSCKNVILEQEENWIELRNDILSDFNETVEESYSIENISDMALVDKMGGHEFEEFCAKLLKNNGFINVSVTPGSGDQGVDVLAEKDNIKYAIQCKNYSSPLGNTPIQEVNSGKEFYNCHVGVVMTNSIFTSGAKELADATKVLLWNREKLQEMMR